MSRKEARDIAFKVIYQNEFKSNELDNILKNTIQENEINNEEILKYINTVVLGIRDNAKDIEEYIIKNLKENWGLNRISKLNIAILKIAIFELVYMKEEIPPKVSINEALTLTETYGEQNDKPFINGILAKVLQEVEG